MTASSLLMPHAVCWAAAPRLIWTMVVANFIIFLSYVTICATLLYVARRTYRVMVSDWVWFVIGFALFIVACGATHLMDVITTWIPVFWVDASVVIVTAVLSAYVAFMLIRRAGHISFAINDYARRLAHTEQEKDAMRDKLLAARKLEDWSKLSGVISHEISNPLESIQNVLYLIQTDSGASQEIVSLAEQAKGEVSRVITISRSTLSYHRESPRPELVNLRSVAESVRFLLQGMVHQRGIQFEISGDDVSEVEAYPGETRQVLLNLARNACEATSQPGRKVRLHLANLKDGVELQVMDQGPGIDPRMLPTLFEFGKTTKGQGGNGMGLWMVRQLVTKHGGRVDVDPSYEEGARFILWWPKRFPAPISSEAAVVAEAV